MRIELVYAPGCSSYKKAKSTLEAVIAEERLPCHIEMVEHADQTHDKPAVRVDGQDHHVSHFEALRDFIAVKWKDLTESQFRHAH